MKLSYTGIKDTESFKNAHISLPKYNVEEVAENTKKNPIWLHFGAGNIFRGFIASLQNSLLNQGLANSGIIAAETFDFDIISQIYDPFNNMTLAVTLRPDGTTENQVVASIAEGVKADLSNPEYRSRLKEICTNPGLQMISFTVTEKGYALSDIHGNYFPVVVSDIEAGPQAPHHAMSIVAAMLNERFLAGGKNIAVVSMDNCSHNGEKLKGSVVTIAKEWEKKGFVASEFVSWLTDESKVSFPWSMIDKITPRPAQVIEEQLANLGVEDMAPVITEKHTYIAPFVNAEGPQYLVIEDSFPNGRPSLEKAGVYFTDRETVNNVERMKVTTCLNPLHTALAVYGCLLGYDSIASEMKDEQLVSLVKNIGYQEGMPVVTDPGIISPKAFIDEVIEERLPNPFIPDMPQRIATDTSQKIPVRFGETMKSYASSPSLKITDLTYIPLALAGWLRYLLGVNDAMESMELSGDPMLATLQEELTGIQVGNPGSCTTQLTPILKNKAIFGVDLVEEGLADKVTEMFREMLAGKGAVRETLKKYCK